MRDVFTLRDTSKSFVENDGQYSFEFENQKISHEFYQNNTNVALYNAELRLDSNQIKYKFSCDSIVEITKNLIFNNLANISVMQKNTTSYTIDVPFVSIPNMTDDEKLYKLSAGEILDTQSGYVGYATKDVANHRLNIVASSYFTIATVPGDLADDYSVAIGWNLEGGLWTMFLAIYDETHVYTASTLLSNITSGTSQSDLDLSDWEPVASLPIDNIVLIKWYNNDPEAEPMPLILRKLVVSPPEWQTTVVPGSIMNNAYVLLSDAAQTLTIEALINGSILNTGAAGANTLTIGYISDSTLQTGIAADTLVIGTIADSTILTGDGATTFTATDVFGSTITTGTGADTFVISGTMIDSSIQTTGAGATTVTLSDVQGDSSIITYLGADTVTIASIADTTSIDVGLAADTVTLSLVKDGYNGNVSLGSEADTLTMTLDAGSSLGVNAMFDGGSGADILTLTGVTQQQWDDGVKDQFTNFETITLI